jgi:hypothetical protein
MRVPFAFLHDMDGNPVRQEHRLGRSPSFWIKNADIAQTSRESTERSCRSRE